MTIWIRYLNEKGKTLQASIHTDGLPSNNRADHEGYALEKLKAEYPAGSNHEVLPPLCAANGYID
ncbi:hypothetical protein J4377_13630 [Halomonas sp. XH26]|uniref:hypothetical protein n=1 Tax=Halomonas sp. XH26 TaxID=2557993 RepID=UPI00209E2670|nr:hypothetical protein [Halomonas sp. XH26]UTA78993.1 hypothetical protein J4377_13630 [Halomonas sp. XH26]